MTDVRDDIAHHVVRVREDEAYACDPELNAYIRERAKLYHRAIRLAVRHIDESWPKFMFGMAARARVVRMFRARLRRDR